ncbi:putative reverse transcriptase domain-containing protein [Tanacetum coccineum]
MAIVAVPAIVLEDDLENESSEAPPSSDYVPASPDYFLGSDTDSDSEDDSFGDDISEIVGLEVQDTPKPLAPLQIVPALSALPCRPAILIRPGQAILFGRLLCIRPNGVLNQGLYLHHHHHTLDHLVRGLVLHLHHQIPHTHHHHHHLITGVGSPTPPLPALVVPSSPALKLSPPRKRVRGAPSGLQEVVHSETTIEVRLDDHSEMIVEMYEHLLDMPFTRLKTTEQSSSLHLWACPAEQRDGIDRDMIFELEDRLGYAEYHIKQDELAIVSDRVRIRKIKQHLGIKIPTIRQGMTTDAIEQLIAECVAVALTAHETNWDNGTEGAVGLEKWYKKMEYVFHISNFGLEVDYEMSWKELMKMMTKVCCPRNKIQKIESKLWSLTVKGTDVVGYNKQNQELALMCSRMVLDEKKKIERYIWGLPDNIQGNITSAEPTRFQDAVRLANRFMDQKVRANAARQAENKIIWESNQGNNCVQQPPPKSQNVATRPRKNKVYAGTLPYCIKYK